MYKKRVFSYVDADDSVPIQKLSIKDQLRLLLQKITYDDATEMNAMDAVTLQNLTLKADLMTLIDKATKQLRDGKHSCVKLSISNQFDPVLKEVLESKEVNNYYNYEVSRPNIDYDIPLFNIVKLEVRTY